MDVQPQLSDITRLWLTQLSQTAIQLNNDSEDKLQTSDSDNTIPVMKTSNISATNKNHLNNLNNGNAFGANIDLIQLNNFINRNNEHLFAALLKKTNTSIAVPNPIATTTVTNQKQQQNALIPPTPPRTPITTSTQQQQMTDGGSDDDDSENKSIISMANRKRKLNSISGSNKRIHMENPIKMDTDNTDSDSNHEYTDRPMSSNDNDDGASSRMSDFDDGNTSLKNRPYTDINDASFDSSLSAYLQETNKAIKSAQPTLNLSQSLSNIVDVSGLNLTKDKYFEKPTMNFLSPANNALKMALQTEDSKLIDSGKYLSKYSSFMECNHDQCAIDKLREHFHCLDILCLSVNKVLSKREEVLRHLKWHKKRNESLTHGFLRFSSTDDCSIQFGECQHNGKQTHYHCLQGNCDKVYISTSDVQMHSNYHRKDSAIMQEGFQRFRATEECNADFCSFAGQRTTHFHCIRDSCNYTFKNKAEMEKHKTYHIKDELLARDGFKKFMKHEPCSFDRCRFSLQCNHIHCVRDNCFYVLHSSGQLLSHKRKHDRQDSEQAYQQYKNAHKGDNSFNAEHNELEKFASGAGSKDLSHIASILSSFGSENDSFDMFQQLQKQALLQCQAKAAAAALVNKNNEFEDEHNSLDNNNYDPIDATIPKSFIQNANATLGRSITPAELEQLKQIYSAAESAKQKQINALLFAQNNFNGNDQAEPLNLNVKKESKELNDTLLSAVVSKIQNQNMPSSLQQVTSIDGLFNRKRGRPPKNRVVEVYGNVQSQARPSAIFTSFKLEKNGKASSLLSSDNSIQMKSPNHNQSAESQPDGNSSSKESTPPQLLSNRLSDSSGSSTNDRKRRLSFSTSPSNDTDKVSIVRAAGTFFPQNCGDENETSVSRRKSKENSTTSDYSINPSKKCKTSACNNQSNENHYHCDECSETFDDDAKLATHSQLKHKDEMANDSENQHGVAPTQEMIQNLAKQMASQQQSLFGIDSFMNPALMLNQMQMNNDGFQFNDQLSAQIQTLCLAQLAALYQNNPMMYQHLYPLLGAIEQLKQEPAQRMFPAIPMSPLSFGGFDLTKMAVTASAVDDTNKTVLGKRQTSKTADNGKSSKQATSTSNVGNNRNSGNFKIFKDEPIPTGYLKFRFNEDCNFPNCGYSNLQSHFHCCRTDCHYSFCDKTRFVQHTARHERLDKLMGDDFKQYRANMSCGYVNCDYKSNMGVNNKSSHFHCLKCDFICSDTNKVVAHRRHHNKLEYIRTAGFRKIANNEQCTVVSKKQSSTETDDESIKSEEHGDDGSNECIYSMKQTHYHCLVCDCAVLSRAQLGSHQHKN